jgi:hypothetical protein
LHFIPKSAKIYDMKRLFLPIFVLLLLAGGVGLLGAIELEFMWGVDGFTLPLDKTSAYAEPGAEKQFLPYAYWLVNMSFSHNISESLDLYINFERDKLLQNSINALFGAKTDYFNVKFGPFLGLLDDFSIPDIGIIGNMELNIPGIVSLSISGSSTLGSQYAFTSQTNRETAGAKIGFWIDNVIPSFSAIINYISRQPEEFIVIDDTLLKYYLSMEFYAKNSNISGFINLGYQTLKRIYKRGDLEFSDELSSWLAGFGISWQIIRQLCIKAEIEIPFFISSPEPLIVTQESLLFSRLFTGVVYSIK